MCHFTVYPSLAEGFGLPIIESGKPCICSNLGAIGEISTKGGCLTVDSPTPTNLTCSMAKLLKDDSLYDEKDSRHANANCEHGQTMQMISKSSIKA